MEGLDDQKTLGYEKYGKTIGQAQFLAEMEQMIPSERLLVLIEPFYPKVDTAQAAASDSWAHAFLPPVNLVRYRIEPRGMTNL